MRRRRRQEAELEKNLAKAWAKQGHFDATLSAVNRAWNQVQQDNRCYYLYYCSIETTCRFHDGSVLLSVAVAVGVHLRIRHVADELVSSWMPHFTNAACNVYSNVAYFCQLWLDSDARYVFERGSTFWSSEAIFLGGFTHFSTNKTTQ